MELPTSLILEVQFGGTFILYILEKEKIYLAGFDGYDDNDELNIKLKNYFKFLVTKTKFKFNFLGKSLFK